MSLDWPCLFLHPTAQQDIFFSLLQGFQPFPQRPLVYFRCFSAATTMHAQLQGRRCDTRRRRNSAFRPVGKKKIPPEINSTTLSSRKVYPLQKSSSASSYSTSPFYSDPAHHYYDYLFNSFYLQYVKCTAAGSSLLYTVVVNVTWTRLKKSTYNIL